MREGQTGGGAIDDDETDPVQAIVTSAISWSSDQTLSISHFHAIVDQAELPASLFKTVVEAVESAGIQLVAEPDLDDDEDELDGRDDGGWNVDGFQEFMRRNSHELLSQQEEYELGRRVQRGLTAAAVLEQHPDLPPEGQARLRREVRDGQRAADSFVEHNLRLVAKIANRLRWQSTPALEIEDLFQHGCLGLNRAIQKFDPTKGFKFSTYAVWWIRQSMERAIADYGQVIRLPVHARDTLRRILRIEREIEAAGFRPTVAEIAAQAELPPKTVKELLKWRNNADSLDRLVGSGESTIGSLLADPNASAPERIAEAVELHDELELALDTLPERSRRILRLRFGLEDGRSWTLEEIGQLPEFAVTRERIRQIESKAIGQLESSRMASSLREFIDPME